MKHVLYFPLGFFLLFFFALKDSYAFNNALDVSFYSYHLLNKGKGINRPTENEFINPHLKMDFCFYNDLEGLLVLKKHESYNSVYFFVAIPTWQPAS